MCVSMNAPVGLILVTKPMPVVAGLVKNRTVAFVGRRCPRCFMIIPQNYPTIAMKPCTRGIAAEALSILAPAGQLDRAQDFALGMPGALHQTRRRPGERSTLN